MKLDSVRNYNVLNNKQLHNQLAAGAAGNGTVFLHYVRSLETQHCINSYALVTLPDTLWKLP